MQVDRYVAILADQKTREALKSFELTSQDGNDQNWQRFSMLIDPVQHHKFGGSDEITLWELVQMLLADRVRHEVDDHRVDVSEDVRRLVEIDWMISARAFESMSEQISALQVRENPELCEAIEIEIENLEMEPAESQAYKEKFFAFFDDLAKLLWENRNRDNTLLIFRVSPAFQQLALGFSD
jgi:hypothetical protein